MTSIRVATGSFCPAGVGQQDDFDARRESKSLFLEQGVEGRARAAGSGAAIRRGPVRGELLHRVRGEELARVPSALVGDALQHRLSALVGLRRVEVHAVGAGVKVVAAVGAGSVEGQRAGELLL